MLKFQELNSFKNETVDSIQTLAPVALVTDYFVNMLIYTKSTKLIINRIADDIGSFVDETVDDYQENQVLPIVLMVFTTIFVPLILYITFKGTVSMLT